MKKIFSILLSLLIIFSSVSIPSSVSASSAVVESAISWAIAIANDNSHGYSQSSRWGPDYDCSSFVISAFRNAGVDTGTATYTGNMRSQFTQHGFQWIPWNQIGSISNLQRGDILLNEAEHTEIYLGNGQNVGAHSNRGFPQTGDQNGTEVSVSGYYDHPWNGVLRYVVSDVCNCSTDYAGDYYVSTNSLPLTMRSGHGTGYAVVASIPKGSTVYVSRADGSWAHVEWNGYSGYCSMTYLTKIEQNSKSYYLHVWVSDTGMGTVPSKFVKGQRYYICYELIDEATGQKANETSNMNYQATETIRNSDGTVFEHTYNNSDNNWISTICSEEDTYTGTVTITGDVEISCSVSFDVWADVGPQIGVWAWEGDESNKVDTIKAGQTTYCSYHIRDKYTEQNLNSVTTRYIQGNGYTVAVKVYDPNGVLVKSQTYKNNDSVWISFTPNTVGDYKVVAEVSGSLNGSKERVFSSIETSHRFSSWTIIKSPTCTSTGSQKRTCSYCGKTETQTIAKKAHSYSAWITEKEATCTSTGMKTRTCSACGKEETQVIAMNEHNMNQWSITENATCISTGVKTRTCSECGYIERETIPMTSHNMDSWKIQREATCSTTGVKTRVCSNCGQMEKQVIPIAEHKMGAWTVSQEATCSAAGMKTRTCSVCGYVEKQSIKATEHVIVFDQAVPATYFDEGKTEGSHCQKCGKVITKQETLPKLKLKIPTVKIKNKKKNIVIKYSKIPGVTKYELRIKGKGKWKKYMISGYSFKIKKMKRGVRYKVKVRAIISMDGHIVYSKFSPVKKVKLKK